MEEDRRGDIGKSSRSVAANINSFLREAPRVNKRLPNQTDITRQVEVVRKISQRLLKLSHQACQIFRDENQKSIISNERTQISNYTTFNHHLSTINESNHSKLISNDTEQYSNMTGSNPKSFSTKLDDDTISAIIPSEWEETISFEEADCIVIREISQTVTALGHAFTKLIDIIYTTELSVSYFLFIIRCFDIVHENLYFVVNKPCNWLKQIT